MTAGTGPPEGTRAAGTPVLRRERSAPKADAAYVEHVGEIARGRLRAACAVLLVVFALDGVYEYASRPEAFRGTFSVRLVVAGACALVLLTLRARRAPATVRALAVLLVAGVAVDIENVAVTTGGHASSFFAGLVLLMASVGLLFPFDGKTAMLFSAVVWSVFLAPLVVGWVPVVRATVADQTFLMVCATIVAAVGSYLTNGLRRREFDAREALGAEKELSERLLLNVLPPPIAERLKRGEATIADRFVNVGVLFADIVGFTPLSERMDPGDMVSLLDEIFSAFDHAATRHGLEKIKTIGDAYMAVAGLPEGHDTHLEAVADMALDMQGIIEQIGRQGGIALAVRIGIHSGPVVAGVIGTTKFTYDVWGDTVNVASRMESHGAPGQIHVTDVVRRGLEGRYEFSEERVVEVKGKGALRTSFLLRKHDGRDGPRPT